MHKANRKRSLDKAPTKNRTKKTNRNTKHEKCKDYYDVVAVGGSRSIRAKTAKSINYFHFDFHWNHESKVRAQMEKKVNLFHWSIKMGTFWFPVKCSIVFRAYNILTTNINYSFHFICWDILRTEWQLSCSQPFGDECVCVLSVKMDLQFITYMFNAHCTHYILFLIWLNAFA